MPITGGALNVTSYRHGKRVVFGFSALDLAAGTYLYDLCSLQAGARVLHAALGREVQATGTGTGVLSVVTDEGTPTVLLGSTAIDAKAAVGYVDSYTAAGSGGPASVILGRKRMPAAQKVQLKLVVGAGDLTLSSSGFIVLEIGEEDLNP